MTSRWYVLSCTPRKERMIFHQLRDQGFEVFYPYIVIRTKDLNTLKIEPYFPGYLFVKVDLSSVALSTFQWMPMTSGLICVAGNPAFVPDPMVQAIHRSLKKANSNVLGMPEVLEEASKAQDQDDAFPVAGSLFDPHTPGGDRTRALLQMLQGMNLSPEQ